MDVDKPMYATPGIFMLEFWNRVFIRQVKPILAEKWDRYMKYTEWLAEKTDIGLSIYKPSDFHIVNAFMRSEVYVQMKGAITGHLKTVPRNERFQLRIDMGVEVPETRNILYVAPETCSLNNCSRPKSLWGVCEFHREIWLNTHPNLQKTGVQ
jgi:hypothetical protein